MLTDFDQPSASPASTYLAMPHVQAHRQRCTHREDEGRHGEARTDVSLPYGPPDGDCETNQAKHDV